jgi:hypothetical protein
MANGTWLAEEAWGILKRAGLQRSSVLNAVYHDAAPVHPATGCGEPRLRSTHLIGGLMIVSRFLSSTFR